MPAVHTTDWLETCLGAVCPPLRDLRMRMNCMNNMNFCTGPFFKHPVVLYRCLLSAVAVLPTVASAVAYTPHFKERKKLYLQAHAHLLILVIDKAFISDMFHFFLQPKTIQKGRFRAFRDSFIAYLPYDLPFKLSYCDINVMSHFSHHTISTLQVT